MDRQMAVGFCGARLPQRIVEGGGWRVSWLVGWMDGWMDGCSRDVDDPTPAKTRTASISTGCRGEERGGGDFSSSAGASRGSDSPIGPRAGRQSRMANTRRRGSPPPPTNLPDGSGDNGQTDPKGNGSAPIGPPGRGKGSTTPTLLRRRGIYLLWLHIYLVELASTSMCRPMTEGCPPHPPHSAPPLLFHCYASTLRRCVELRHLQSIRQARRARQPRKNEEETTQKETTKKHRSQRETTGCTDWAWPGISPEDLGSR